MVPVLRNLRKHSGRLHVGGVLCSRRIRFGVLIFCFSLKSTETLADKTSMNVTQVLSAKRDRYASRQGEFILGASVVRIGDAETVWQFVRGLESRTFRVIYVCQDGTVRDMIGRQGVWQSSQDGTVAGTGHAMACAERLNLSFWTFAHGQKVNTGAGKGYRTLRAAGILAIRCQGQDIITDAGLLALAEAGALAAQ